MSFQVFGVKRMKLFCAVAAGLLLAAGASSAVGQKALHHDEVSLSAFGQFTGSASGNGITNTTGDSLGFRGAFRHSYHWWLGYEASYGYTRFTEHYAGQPFGVQHNMHDINGSYLVSTPTSVLGFQPYGLAGVSLLDFSPTLNGGQRAPWQAKAAFSYGLGVDHPLILPNFGVRVEYRGLFYKAPDFGSAQYNTGSFRNTAEPSIGFYARF